MESLTDLKYLEEIAAGDKSFMIDIMETFARQIPEFTGNMRKYLHEKDFKKLAREAHTAKSSVMVFGLVQLAEVLKKLHYMATNEENTEQYAVLIQEFEETCNRAIVEINIKLS